MLAYSFIFYFKRNLTFEPMLKAMVKRALNINEEQTLISKTLQCLDVRTIVSGHVIDLLERFLIIYSI